MSTANKFSSKKIIGLILAAAILIFAAVATPPEGLAVEGMRALLIFLAAMVMLICETLPVSITSFVAMVLLIWYGCGDFNSVMGGFNASMMLFMVGAFSTTAALLKTSIPQRIGNLAVTMSKGKSRLMVLFFILASGVVSSFMSNMATLAVFLGIVLQIIASHGDPKPGTSNLAKCLLMGIAAGSGVGGLGTPVGLTSNMVAMGFLTQATGKEIGFLEWTGVAYPIAIVVLVMIWLVLITIFPPEEYTGEVKDANKELGALSTFEKKTVAILLLIIVSWIAGNWIKPLMATNVAIIGTALFMLPGINTFTWDELNKAINWNMITMTGALMAVVGVVQSTKASDWLIGVLFTLLADVPVIVLLIGMGLIGAICHALIPAGMPVLTLLAVPFIGFASACGISPAVGMMIAAFWASAGLTLPYDALPLLVYGYDHFTAKEFIKQGIPVTILAVILVTILAPILCGIFMPF